MEVVDKHAPLQSKRVSNKHSPWITHELIRKIHKRNYMKKIAIQENNTSAWVRYKQARNEANNAIKSAKKHYFIHNLKLNKKNPRKTWMLIDELSSRKSRRGGGGTPFFGLYGDVLLDRVWFFGLAVLNKVCNLTCLCPKQARTCPKQGMVLLFFFLACHPGPERS